MSKSVINIIKNFGVVPVITIEDADKAEKLAEALMNGGLPVMEITFRTAAAQEAISRIRRAFPEAILGAGTVLTCRQVDRAITAGADFIVAPGFNREIVEYATSCGIPMIPGAATPGEMEQAMALGLDTVKFFPAEQNGGIAAIKAIGGPYKNLSLLPTGGINLKNLSSYLALNNVAACGGSWMAPAGLIAEGRFDEITALVRDSIRAVLGFKLAHVGINCADEGAAQAVAGCFDPIGMDLPQQGNSSIFCLDRGVEVLKTPGRGMNGHIAVSTNDINRAMFYLKRFGVSLDEGSIRKNDAGEVTSVYTEKEVGGFAVHLIRQRADQ